MRHSRRHTAATPPGVPRSRSKVTRAFRLAVDAFHRSAFWWQNGIEVKPFICAGRRSPRCSCNPFEDKNALAYRVDGWLICARCRGRFG